MAPPANPVVEWTQYLGARSAEMTLSMFPLAANLRLGRALGGLLYRLDARHRRRTLHHLDLAFPEMDQARRADLTRRSFEHVIQLAMEVVASPRYLNHGSWSRHIKVTNMGSALDIFSSGQPALVLTGHLGNWEILGTTMALLGYEMSALARPLDNPRINEWMLSIREKRGLRIITKWNATATMLRVLDRGGVLGFIADQNAGDRGMFVPFFGKLASTYKSIGLLALRRRVPVICGYAHRLPGVFRFEMGCTDIIYPEDWAGHPDPLYYITARYMRAIEQMVRMRPEQYLWMHRRWKNRPRFERQGKPMPATLRRQLDSLPWMDQPTLDRLKQPFVPEKT